MASSERARRTDIRQFDAWARAHGTTAATATPQQVAEYVATLVTAGYAARTINRRLWSIGKLDAAAGREPRTNFRIVRRMPRRTPRLNRHQPTDHYSRN